MTTEPGDADAAPAQHSPPDRDAASGRDPALGQRAAARAQDAVDPSRVRPGDEAAMRTALQAAEQAGAGGDVPIGAVVLDPQGEVIAVGHNTREVDHDPTAHAEILALRAAGTALGTWRLTGCTLVVTLEPCAMCAGAVVAGRIARVVLGAWDPKAGACGSTRDIVRDDRLPHRATVTGGVLEAECAAVLQDFFRARR